MIVTTKVETCVYAIHFTSSVKKTELVKMERINASYCLLYAVYILMYKNSKLVPKRHRPPDIFKDIHFRFICFLAIKSKS